MAEGTVQPRIVGRYVIHDEIAAGGMATVHLGRLVGAAGFARTVAVKRLHPQFAKDPSFANMFIDEARLAARIRHPNVVGTIDVVSTEGELLLVMEYVHGESLARLQRHAPAHRVPPAIAASVLYGVLHGLHAAHEARTEQGQPLRIVHRDVSPQNVLVGADGIPRVVDFGVAKAASRAHHSGQGQIKGKLAYMAPEQVRGLEVDRRTDVFAAAVVLWEALAGRRLFWRPEPGATVNAVLHEPIAAPGQIAPDVPPALDEVVLRGLCRDATDRFSTTREMAEALEAAIAPATAGQVSAWIEGVASEILTARHRQVERIESSSAQPPAESAPGGIDGAPAGIAKAVATPPRMPTGEVTGHATASEVRARSGRDHLLWSAGAVGTVLLLAVGAFAAPRWLSRDGGPASAASPDVRPAVSAPAPPGTTMAPIVTAVEPQPPAPSPAEPGDDSAPTVSARPPAPHVHVANGTPAPVRVAPVASTRPPPSCNPPYSIDPEGYRVPKPECL